MTTRRQASIRVPLDDESPPVDREPVSAGLRSPRGTVGDVNHPLGRAPVTSPANAFAAVAIAHPRSTPPMTSSE